MSRKVLSYDKESNNRLLFFCSKFLCSKYLFIDLNIDISTTQMQLKLLKVHQLKDKISFS